MHFVPSIVSPLTLYDVAAINLLEQSIQIDPWSSRDLRESLEQGAIGWGIWNTTHHKELAAYILLKPAVDTADILTLGVHIHSRRLGLAKHCIQHAQQWAPQQSITSLFLEVRLSNTPAIHLYQCCGFEMIYRRAQYYSLPGQPGLREDAWLMKWEMATNE